MHTPVPMLGERRVSTPASPWWRWGCAGRGDRRRAVAVRRGVAHRRSGGVRPVGGAPVVEGAAALRHPLSRHRCHLRSTRHVGVSRCWRSPPFPSTPSSRIPSATPLRIAAPATHYLDVEASFPTSGKPTIDLMMAVWTPGSYLVREFARHVEQVRARNPSGQALATREDAEEPVAGLHRRREERHRDLPGLRQRAAGADRLGGRFVRRHQWGAHLHHPGRAGPAPARGPARAPGLMASVVDRPAVGRRWAAPSLSRAGLRYPGRFADPGRQSGRLPVRRRRGAAPPGERGRGRRLGRRPLHPRRHPDRAGGARAVGRPALRAVSLLQHHHRRLRRHRAQGLHRPLRRVAGAPAPRAATPTGSGWSPTSSFTPGTSSASGRSSSGPSTTRTRCTPEASGSRKG